MQLTDQDVAALTQLFELSDNELLEIILARKSPQEPLNTPAVARVVQMLRDV
jgi:antitoxin CptB